jgi:molybdenum cofactor guanylyltransferase
MMVVAGRPMLHSVLAAVAGARARIVVGPPSLARDLPDGVRLTLETPPGGGPVAAIGAGLTLVPADLSRVAVVAADQPFLTAEAIRHLFRAVEFRADEFRADEAGASSTGSADGETDGAVYVDRHGRQQRGLTVWRAEPLRRFLDGIGDLDGVAMGRLTHGLGVVEVGTPDGAGPPPWYDCDTEQDLRRAEEWSHADLG